MIAPRRRPSTQGGFTLLENMVALTLVAFGLAAIYTQSGISLAVLRSSKDQANASQVLQQRIEQLRIGNWQRVTHPTWLRDNILNVPADGASTLNKLVEVVTITPYDGPGTATNTFTRTNQIASAAGSNASLLNLNAVKVKWTISWSGIPNGKSHVRETLTVLGKGGVAK